jgi:hypothetical protein
MPDGSKYLYLVLPNNPSEENPSALQYDEPRVDALPWVVKTYQALYEFVCELTRELLGFTETPETEMFTFSLKGAIKKTLEPQGSKFIDLQDVVGEICKTKNEYSEQSDV